MVGYVIVVEKEYKNSPDDMGTINMWAEKSSSVTEVPVPCHLAPNLAEGYIAMLYPESPNHPMQSYYLTNKGRELLERL